MLRRVTGEAEATQQEVAALRAEREELTQTLALFGPHAVLTTKQLFETPREDLLFAHVSKEIRRKQQEAAKRKQK